MRVTVSAALRAVAIAGTLSVAGAAGAAPAPDCQCRDPDGGRRDLGTVECVDISGRSWLVRCEMSTNTPYWRRLNEDAGCPSVPLS